MKTYYFGRDFSGSMLSVDCMLSRNSMTLEEFREEASFAGMETETGPRSEITLYGVYGRSVVWILRKKYGIKLTEPPVTPNVVNLVPGDTYFDIHAKGPEGILRKLGIKGSVVTEEEIDQIEFTFVRFEIL